MQAYRERERAPTNMRAGCAADAGEEKKGQRSVRTQNERGTTAARMEKEGRKSGSLSRCSLSGLPSPRLAKGETTRADGWTASAAVEAL